MTWMLTGGAGYIGAHVTRALLESGRPVVVLDDLSTGLARKVPEGVPFEQVDVCDRAGAARHLAQVELLLTNIVLTEVLSSFQAHLMVLLLVRIQLLSEMQP